MGGGDASRSGRVCAARDVLAGASAVVIDSPGAGGAGEAAAAADVGR